MPSSLCSPMISLLLHPPTLLLLMLALIIILIIFSSSHLPNKLTAGVQPLPPSPPKLPIIGNLHQLSPLPHRSLRALSDLHGPLILLHLGRHPTLVVSSPSAVQEITQNQEHLFLNRPLFKATHELFYHGRDIAFAPYGEYWREMKKTAILHLLSSKKVESYEKVREEEVGFMMEEIERTTTANMTEMFNALSRDVVSRVVIGRAARRTWWEHGLRSLIDESSELTGEFYVGDYIPLLGSIIGVVGGFERRLRKVFQRSDELLEQIMRERRKEKGDGNHVANHSFLDFLLTLQDKTKCEGVAFDDASIKAIVKDMFGAGTEATSIPMEWAMAELLRHPTAMKKLKEEIISTVDPNETSIKEKHLSKMSYLKAVIKEVLRLHPPGSIIVRRQLTEETTIKGYRIPKGTMVLINSWVIGRDPAVWESSEEFRLERFINGGARDLGFINHRFQLLAFGVGRRSCPGTQFSLSLIELAVANLVHVFYWKPAEEKVEDIDMGEVYGLTTRKRGGLLLTATKAIKQNSRKGN